MFKYMGLDYKFYKLIYLNIDRHFSYRNENIATGNTLNLHQAVAYRMIVAVATKDKQLLEH